MKEYPSLTKFVVFSFSLLIIYTIVEFIVSSITGQEHTTLTTCFFTCIGGEVFSCCLIKIFKLKEEKESNYE